MKKSDNELKIEYIAVSKLKPYSKNARQHAEQDVSTIIESIKEFGFSDPIGVWSDDNVVVEGHGRLIAAKKLKLKEVPVIRLDHLTDEQRRAYALAHNKTAEMSDWDYDLLNSELGDIFDIDMGNFGFDINIEEEISDEDVHEDAVPEPPKEPISKIGDIWLLGRHRLMCGNSTDKNDIDTLMNGARANLLLTDPPYGINVVAHKTGKIGGDKPVTMGTVHGESKSGIIKQAKVYHQIIGDDSTDTAKINYELVAPISDTQIIFGGNYFTDFLKPSRCWIVWDKQNTGSFADVELAWCNLDKSAKLYHFMWNGLCREGSRELEGKSRVHPTQKPVGLLVDILKDFSNENDIILDCFGGSGSTLIACEHTNRTCYISELSEHYVDTILTRWITLTRRADEVFLIRDGKKLSYAQVVEDKEV